MILALRGIIVDWDREFQLSGRSAALQQGRENINNDCAVLLGVETKWSARDLGAWQQ